MSEVVFNYNFIKIKVFLVMVIKYTKKQFQHIFIHVAKTLLVPQKILYMINEKKTKTIS